METVSAPHAAGPALLVFDQFEEFATISQVGPGISQKEQLEFVSLRQRIERADEGILVFAEADIAGAQNLWR